MATHIAMSIDTDEDHAFALTTSDYVTHSLFGLSLLRNALNAQRSDPIPRLETHDLRWLPWTFRHPSDRQHLLPTQRPDVQESGQRLVAGQEKYLLGKLNREARQLQGQAPRSRGRVRSTLAKLPDLGHHLLDDLVRKRKTILDSRHELS
ncbi:MAG: hypothetical protein GJU76_14520 [Gallionella sp.]|nr:hypothetical protein [Gallionella sp.]